MFRTPRWRRLVRDCIEFVADAALYLAAMLLLIVILAELVRLAPAFRADTELQQRRGPGAELERTEGARFRTIVGSNEDGVFGISREGWRPDPCIRPSSTGRSTRRSK